MRKRTEAVVLIHKQLENGSYAQKEKTCHHYGKVELRELLDFIYEDKPVNEYEEIESDT